MGEAGEFPWWTEINNKGHEQTQHIQKPWMWSQVPAETCVSCPHNSPWENLMRCVLGHPTFQRNKLRLREPWWHFYDIQLAEAETQPCWKGGICSPRKQIFQEHLGSGESLVRGREGGEVWDVPTEESWSHDICHLHQCASLEGLPFEGFIQVKHELGCTVSCSSRDIPSVASLWILRSTEVWSSSKTPSPSRPCAREGSGVTKLHRVLSIGFKSTTYVWKMGLLI